MSYELVTSNQSQQQFLRRLSAAYRRHQLYEPSVWLQTDPDIEAKMLRDPDIAEAVNYRCALIAGRQWTLQAKSKNSPRADLSVEIGTQLLGELKKFTDARKRLARAFFHGKRSERIHGEVRRLKIGDGIERNWWIPTGFEDASRELGIFPTVDSDAGTIDARYKRWNIARSDWEILTERQKLHLVIHSYGDEQDALGFGKGLRDALGWVWHSKTHVWEEAMRAIERFAGGAMVAKIDMSRDANSGLPNEELIEATMRLLENMRGRHSIVLGTGDEIEVLSGSAEGWQMLQDAREALRTMVKTLVLSANLTTSADKGGSYALGEIQENSTESLVQADRESLEETLTDSLVKCTWFNNHPNLVEFGLVDEQPRFNIKQEKRHDPKARADVANIAHSMGLPLSKEDVYEQLGFRKPQKDEEVLEGASPIAPPPAGGPPGLGTNGIGTRGIGVDLLDMIGVRKAPPPAPPAPPGSPEGQQDDTTDAREETNQPPAAAKAG